MSPHCRNLTHSSPFGRRELLRVGGLGLFGLTLRQWLAGEPARAASQDDSFGRAKACIFLFMWGGPAQHDTWDLKPDAPAEIRGEFKPIPTVTPGLQICEHFPELSKRTDRLTLIRSMTHGDVNHTSATHYLLTGQAPPPSGEKRAQWPSIGAALAKLGRGAQASLPPFVTMRPKMPGDVPRFVEQSQGQFAGWLGPRYDPLTIDARPDLPEYQVADLQLDGQMSIRRLRDRKRLLAQLNEQVRTQSSAIEAKSVNEQRAFELLTSATSGAAAFDLTREPRAVRERYGMNPHGQSVLQARRLVERGVPLVTVFWPNDGIKNVSVYWDTHSRNFIDHKDRLMPPADQAFSALLDDLQQRGMLDETLVIWSGEFGRTPKVGQRNSDAGAGRDGRDHWPNCFTSVLAGGGVKGGYIHGRSDQHAAYPAADAVSPAQLAATVYHLLGVPPEQTLRDAADRPHLLRTDSPVRAILT